MSSTNEAPKVGAANSMLAHYLVEIEKLLTRVERATNHYQVLSVGEMSTGEEIRLAHQWAMTLLNPGHCGIAGALPAETDARIRRAIEKTNIAVAAVMRKANSGGGPTATESTKLPVGKKTPESNATAGASNTLNNTQSANGPSCEDWNRAMNDNRRRVPRIKLAIPARVTGYNSRAKWNEMTQTIDVSRLGVALKIQTRVRHGLVIHLSMPFPVKLRNHGHADSTYNVYAIVRQIEPARGSSRIVRLEFLGKEPPRGYFDKPWASFRTTNRSGAKRRREPRVNRTEPVRIEYLNESLVCIEKSTAMTVDLSRTGARIRLKSTPPEFDFVRITSLNHAFESLAIARNRYTGDDGFECLSLRFIENAWPI
ncbi:MAG TPA: PilZ domain-containing protein [Blastocatellia bacterium]|nr:PilZ domain-containing protein [Blastocatellia bacterium]